MFRHHQTYQKARESGHKRNPKVSTNFGPERSLGNRSTSLCLPNILYSLCRTKQGFIVNRWGEEDSRSGIILDQSWIVYDVWCDEDCCHFRPSMEVLQSLLDFKLLSTHGNLLETNCWIYCIYSFFSKYRIWIKISNKISFKEIFFQLIILIQKIKNLYLFLVCVQQDLNISLLWHSKTWEREGNHENISKSI